MTEVLALLLGLAVGAGSALVPVLNAEAYAVVAAGSATPVAGSRPGRRPRRRPDLREARAVRGRPPWQRTTFPGASPSAGATPVRPRWSDRVSGWLTGRVSGAATVLSAAVTGLPPLAVVSVAAGAAGQRRTTFACWCLAGRVVRFAALVLPAAYVLG